MLVLDSRWGVAALCRWPASGEPYTVSVWDTAADPGPIEVVLASVKPGGADRENQIVLHAFAVDEFADQREPAVRVTNLPQEVIDAAADPDEAVLSMDELTALVATAN